MWKKILLRRLCEIKRFGLVKIENFHRVFAVTPNRGILPYELVVFIVAMYQFDYIVNCRRFH